MEFEVEIEGKSPYMQHRMDDTALETWEKNRKLIIERVDLNKDDYARALFHSYNDEKGFYIPSEHIRSSLIQAGGFMKSKVGNARKSMKNIVAAMFSIKQEKIYTLSKEFEIDKRSGVNKATRARVIVIRPKWTSWTAGFTLNVDNETFTKETIEQLLEYSGNYCGIGSFRPLNNGPFGRFKVVKVERLS
jgi:hypothetical protein